MKILNLGRPIRLRKRLPDDYLDDIDVDWLNIEKHIYWNLIYNIIHKFKYDNNVIDSGVFASVIHIDVISKELKSKQVEPIDFTI